MTPPIWYDWEYRPPSHDTHGHYVAFWKGATDDGRTVSVPCVYADSDVLNNTPREMEELKAHIKENGLNSYYDIGREIQYDSNSTAFAGD